MWDLIVSVPDHCLSFYFVPIFCSRTSFLWDVNCSTPGAFIRINMVY